MKTSSIIIVLITFFSSGIVFKSQLKKSSVITKTKDTPKVGEKIKGDFNGDQKMDFAIVKKTKEQQGNPIENGTPAEYEIQFSDPTLKSMKVGCCDIRLINEGDLNNDGSDEISVFQAPMNGCTYSMTTYSFSNGKWKKLIDPFLIPTGCETLTDNDLQQRIFKENKTIYYLETDMTNENGTLVKKKVISK